MYSIWGKGTLVVNFGLIDVILVFKPVHHGAQVSRMELETVIFSIAMDCNPSCVGHKYGHGYIQSVMKHRSHNGNRAGSGYQCHGDIEKPAGRIFVKNHRDEPQRYCMT